MQTPADRVKRHDENLAAAGGRVIHKLRLKPPAAAALAEHETRTGMSPTAIINELLENAK